MAKRKRSLSAKKKIVRGRAPDKLMRTSMASAKSEVAAILARRKEAKRLRQKAPAARVKALGMKVAARGMSAAAAAAAAGGLIVAEGDSWFDYPFHDVLKSLEDVYGYDVDSAAHKGDAVEDMAYGGGNGGGQLDDFSRHVQRHVDAGRTIRVILLSGGGNDLAGDQFYMLLNHAASGLPPLSEELLVAIIDQRMRAAYTHILTTITALTQQQTGARVPIVLHGYGYPVPDGRGFLGGWGPLPGPWLKPGFDRKGYGDRLANTIVMKSLIDRLYAMIYSIAGTAGFEHVHVVDVRALLSDDLGNYKKDWGNELHPTADGFETVAAEFVRTIGQI